MFYDPNALRFTLFSSDSSLSGALEYTLSAKLKDFPSVQTPQPQVGTVTIVDPCSDANVSASGMADQEYTIGDASFDFDFTGFTSDNAQCQTIRYLVDTAGVLVSVDNITTPRATIGESNDL